MPAGPTSRRKADEPAHCTAAVCQEETPMPLEVEEKMNKKEAMRFAARMLAKKKLPDEVAQMLSNKGDMSWVKAEEIVQEVKEHRQGTISRMRAPGQIFSSIFLVVLGGFTALIYGRTLEAWGLPTPYQEQLQAIEFPVDIIQFYGYGGTDMISVAITGGALALLAVGVLVFFSALVTCLRP
jgi:hypothetical protein